MSRCFPFPPPGYERQARSDHIDLLAKEKQKEKKRKKEKKDKEKREGKDKKEKDRSKDKHKEKKERREKDKDQKKEKDKNPSVGVRVDKQSEPNHYEPGECSQKAKETSHSEFAEDLDRRIKNEQKVAASRIVENINVPLHRSISRTASPSPMVDRVGGCSQKAKETSHSKFTEDFGSIKDEQKVAASRIAENINVPLHRSISRTASPSPMVDRVGGCSQMAKETSHSKFTEDLDRRIKDEQKVAASRMVENFNVPVHRSTGRTASPSPMVDRVAGSRVIQPSMADSQKRDIRVEKPADNLFNSARRADVLSFSNAVQEEKNTDKKVAPKLYPKGDALSFSNAMQKEKNTSSVAPKPEQKGDIVGLGSVAQRDYISGQRLAPKIEQKGAIGTELAARNSKVSIRKPEGFAVTASAEKENKSKNSDLNSDISVKRAINGMNQPRNGMSQLPEALANLPHEKTSIHLSTEMDKKIDNGKNQSLAGQRDIDGMARLVDNGGQRPASGTDKLEDQVRKEEKQKDRDHKKHKSKHKHKDKEKDTEKTRERSEKKKKDHDELIRDKGKEDQIDGPKLNHLAAQVDGAKSQLPNGIMKKRKEVEANGFLHENDPRLNKFPKTTPSHRPVENGNRFPASPITPNCLSVKPEATNNAIAGKLPIDSKNHVTNGISKAQSLSAPLRHPDTINISAANGVSLKPHPDDKYLNKIYSVPKLEELQEYDDQEWLFKPTQSQKKSQLTHETVELPQVWAEALRLESDDVIAMPYVIPF